MAMHNGFAQMDEQEAMAKGKSSECETQQVCALGLGTVQSRKGTRWHRSPKPALWGQKLNFGLGSAAEAMNWLLASLHCFSLT